MNHNEIETLKELCKQIRRDVLTMIHSAKSGHPGGSLSAVEIFAVLYKQCMNNFCDWTKSPNHCNRDRFVLSKGHASAVLYATLAECGYFDKKELMGFRKLGSRLQGHPNTHLEGIEVATGSLGQGLSMACGIAMALKLDKNPANVFCYMGDGELQEGSVWEAFMHAPHRDLGNLVAIIDRNNLQIDGFTETIKDINPLDKKLEAFNWRVIEIDGHNIEQIYNAIETAKKNTCPTAIIANTIKGKGISFMENKCGWHGKAPNDEELALALEELK